MAKSCCHVHLSLEELEVVMRNDLVVYSLHSYLDASELSHSGCSPVPPVQVQSAQSPLSRSPSELSLSVSDLHAASTLVLSQPKISANLELCLLHLALVSATLQLFYRKLQLFCWPHPLVSATLRSSDGSFSSSVGSFSSSVGSFSSSVGSFNSSVGSCSSSVGIIHLCL